jgi:hypothetical protein
MIDAAYEERISDMITAEQFDMIISDGQDSLTNAGYESRFTISVSATQMAALRRHYRVERVRNIDNVSESEWVPLRR